MRSLSFFMVVGSILSDAPAGDRTRMAPSEAGHLQSGCVCHFHHGGSGKARRRLLPGFSASPILEELRLAAGDEQSAVEFLESRRWGADPGCPRCGDMAVYRMLAQDGGRNKDYRWRCRGCKRMFTVRTATVMEESRLPVRIWVYAFWKACSSKKGISALQLSREMGITHKSALFVLHRIRHAMSSEGESAPKLQGVIEADETYVGGRPRLQADGTARPTAPRGG